ncbi:hypothetical protein LXL04_033182 [Taraxacum kok-saghyz]
MAESETADSSKNVIKVEEEIEGDQIGTKNYRFSKIGESVPIKSDADFKFDMDNLPSRPMAVSERFGVIFVAHSSGFCVARTKDVINTAEELKNEGNGSCIQELSLVDVSLGKVSILTLSSDSSLLAASVGFNLHFFSVDGLLNKDHEPLFSKALSESSSIKDMQWNPRLKDKYVVLTSDGKLYHAAGQDDLNNLMDNVDAVNWSVDGKFLAVAKYDYLSILSSKFEEKLRIKLLLDSLVDDSDADSAVKVDSVRWVRPDCIIIGCYRLNADMKEENYLLQLISVKDDKITNPSSNPVALAFSDAFLSINDDIVPSGSGPHMLVSYLDECKVAFVANRKNIDQHIVLFAWSSDNNNNKAEMIEIMNDAWMPTINLQENSDDNLILGIAVDKVYKDEKLIFTLGEKDTEVSPSCVLLCLTIDAKLFMFHFASATATGPSLDVPSVSDEEPESPPISTQHQVSNIDKTDKQIEDQKVKVNEPSEKASHEANKDEKLKPTEIPQDLKKIEIPKVVDSASKPAIDKSNKPLFGESPQGFKVSTESSFTSGPLFSKNAFGVQTSSGVQASTGLSFSKTSFASSGSFSSGPLFSSSIFGAQSSSSSSFSPLTTESSSKIGSSTSLPVSSSMFSSRTFDVKPPVTNTAPITSAVTTTTSFSSTPQKFTFPKMPSGPSPTTSTSLFGSQGGSVVSSAPPSMGKPLDLRSSDKGSQRSQTQSRMLSSNPNLPEQRTVEEMAKELDTLLESIQGPGGFYDASVAAHKQSVTSLEEGILVLSERCQNWTDRMDEGMVEVQGLLDKTVQVLARKIYMEAIVKQATDSQYLDIWNRQKLNSELDMKRKHILEINQNLTNQLIELERHLNTLELQRFGDKGDLETNRRSFHPRHGPSRHVQSLHSLHNTMNAQLSAAEKLSECLSKQMSVLSIETGPAKKQNVKKELFDAIGISYDNSPRTAVPPKSQLRSPTASSDIKKSQQLAVKSSEPETARRRRDSLDRSWASIEPTKTTVKRMVLKEDRQISPTPARLSLPPGTQKPDQRLSAGPPKASHDIPRGTLNLSQIRGSQDTQMKRNSNSSLWGSDSSKTPVTLASGSQSKPIVSQEGEKSKSPFTFPLKLDPVVVNNLKISQPEPLSNTGRSPIVNQDAEKSKSRFTFPSKSVNDPKISQLEQPSSNTSSSRSPATNLFQMKPIDFSESSNKETDKSKSTENTSIWNKKSQDSPFSGLSSATSASTAFSGKSFSLESSSSSSSTKDKQGNEAAPSSSTSANSSTTFGIKSGATHPTPPSAPSPIVTLTPSSSTSTPADSSSTTFGIKSGVTQTTESSAPAPSIPSFSFSISPSKPNPDTTESSTPTLPTLPKFDNISPPTPVVSSVPTNTPSLPTNPTPEVTVTQDQEDEMEEEAPVSDLSGNLGGFGLGSTPNPNPNLFGAPKPNPFGGPFGNAVSAPPPSFTPPQQTSGLFRPASFNVQSSPPSQPSQPPQQGSFGAFSGGFGGGGGGGGQGFGQPAQIGSGQQVLGSVLGSFGQSRQFGAPTSFGGSGFGGGQTAGGFAAPSGGGFSGLAAGGGGGFAAAATGGGGFAAAATGNTGFGGAGAGGGGGFGGAAAGGGGGFGGFGSQAGSGSGFSAFGNGGGTAARPPSELFTQMRR